MPDRNEDENKEGLPSRYPFSVVVGPVGVGKSTFTELLVKEMGVVPFQEPYLTDPYLHDFYTKDPANYAFYSQMFFLTDDGVQATKISEASENGPVFKDAGKDMNRIIEKVQWEMNWIMDEDHEAYISSYHNIYRDKINPDVYIALKASENTVIERIVRRDREMELIFMEKHPDYFLRLVWEFNIWLEKRLRDGNSKVVVIDTDKFDFTKKGNQREAAITEAKNWLGYFLSNPNQRNLISSDGARLIIPNSFRPRPNLIDRVPGKTRIS